MREVKVITLVYINRHAFLVARLLLQGCMLNFIYFYLSILHYAVLYRNTCQSSAGFAILMTLHDVHRLKPTNVMSVAQSMYQSD